jgi:hypothetical protein
LAKRDFIAVHGAHKIGVSLMRVVQKLIAFDAGRKLTAMIGIAIEHVIRHRCGDAFWYLGSSWTVKKHNGCSIMSTLKCRKLAATLIN